MKTMKLCSLVARLVKISLTVILLPSCVLYLKIFSISCRLFLKIIKYIIPTLQKSFDHSLFEEGHSVSILGHLRLRSSCRRSANFFFFFFFVNIKYEDQWQYNKRTKNLFRLRRCISGLSLRRSQMTEELFSS